jgi:hypothetical protein
MYFIKNPEIMKGETEPRVTAIPDMKFNRRDYLIVNASPHCEKVLEKKTSVDIMRGLKFQWWT